MAAQILKFLAAKSRLNTLLRYAVLGTKSNTYWFSQGTLLKKTVFQANCYENKLLCLVSNTIPLSETVRLGHSKTLKHLLMPISCHQFLIFGDALIPVRPVIHVKNVLKHLVTKVLLQKLWTLVGHLVDCFEGCKTTNTTISDSQAFLFWESPARYSQRMPS